MPTTLLTLTRALSARSNKLNWLRANMWADNRLVSAEGITDEISEARLAAMVKRARATWAENHKHWTAESDAEFMASRQQPPKPSPGNSKKRASSSSGSGEDEDGGDGDDEEERARKAAKVAPKGFSELKGLMETMEQPAPRRGRRGNY